jgi:hypothetical protein
MRWFSTLAVFFLAVAAQAQVCPDTLADAVAALQGDAFTATPSDWLEWSGPYKGLGGWICPPVPGAQFTRCEIVVYTGDTWAAQGPQTFGLCSYGLPSDAILSAGGPDYWHMGSAGPCPPDQGAFCETVATAWTRANGGGGGAIGSCLRYSP